MIEFPTDWIEKRAMGLNVARIFRSGLGLNWIGIGRVPRWMMAAVLRFISWQMISNTKAYDVLTDMESWRYTCLTAAAQAAAQAAARAAARAAQGPARTQKQKKVAISVLVSNCRRISSIASSACRLVVLSALPVSILCSDFYLFFFMSFRHLILRFDLIDSTRS